MSFRTDRCMENLRRLGIIAKVLMSYIIWLGLISCYYLLLGQVDLSRISGLFLIYLLFFIFNLACVVVARTFKSRKNLKSLVCGETFVIFSACIIMLFGVSISLIDQKDYGHIIIYFICVLCCMSYFLLSARQIILPFLATALAISIGLLFKQPDITIRTTHYINIALFLPLIFLISRIIYRDYTEKYQSIKMLEKETQRSKMLFKELDQANHILRKLASIDELTGIANRRGLNHYLEISLEGCTHHKLPLSVAMVDIDFFKEYNDTYGHLKGDIVLKQVAEQLSSIAADLSGLVARWGGEEFVIVACGMTAEEVHEVCREILGATDALQIEHSTSKILSTLTVSIGVCSMFIKTYDEFIKCIECADKALYYAKQEGRHRYKYFDFTNLIEKL